MGQHERRELFSDPPEHQEGDELDSIGLHEGGRRPSGRRPSGRRPGSERGTRPGSSRSSSPDAARSRRERTNLAREKLRKLIPVGILLGIFILGGFACLIPGYIRGKHLAALESGDAQVRETAAHNLKGEAALDALRRLVESGKPDGSGGAAAMALAGSGAPGLERLRAAAGAPEPDARVSAAFGLGLTRSPAAVEPLAALLAGDAQKPVRLQAARSLGLIRAPAAVAALIAQGGAEDDIRQAAVHGVLAAACPEAREPLVAGLGAASEEMRIACRQALLATGSDALVGKDELLKLAADEKPAVRAGAVRLAALLPGGPFAEMLPRALADRSEAVRTAAAEAAELRGATSVCEALEKAVAAPEENLQFRVAAARALGSLGRMESLPALAACLAAAGGPEEARAAAADALAAIAGKHKFWKLTAKGEFNDSLTHLRLYLKTPDPRWSALAAVVAACDSFKGEALTAKGYAALQALAGRKLAAKPEIWKAWMARKLEEGRTLGEISHLFEEAYKAGTKNADARPKAEAAMRLAKGLRRKAEDADQAFYQALFEDLCRTLTIDHKKEILKDDPPPAAPGTPGTPAEKKDEPEKKEEKKD